MTMADENQKTKREVRGERDEERPESQPSPDQSWGQSKQTSRAWGNLCPTCSAQLNTLQHRDPQAAMSPDLRLSPPYPCLVRPSSLEPGPCLPKTCPESHHRVLKTKHKHSSHR